MEPTRTCRYCEEVKPLNEMETKYQCSECKRTRYLNYQRQYRLNNLQYFNNYQKNRMRGDPQFKLYQNIRRSNKSLINDRNYRKTNTLMTRTLTSLGLSKELFQEWIAFNLERDNLNDYHLDHVRPLSSFNCRNWRDIFNTECNHWTNIIPISPVDNHLKKNREPTQQELLKLELRVETFKRHYNLE